MFHVCKEMLKKKKNEAINRSFIDTNSNIAYNIERGKKREMRFRHS